MPKGHDMRAWLGTVLAIVVAIGSVFTAWKDLAAENADTKRRLATVEHRQEEDRRIQREEQREIKSDVKDVKGSMELILRKLDRIEDRGARAERKPPAQ